MHSHQEGVHVRKVTITIVLKQVVGTLLRTTGSLRGNMSLCRWGESNCACYRETVTYVEYVEMFRGF